MMQDNNVCLSCIDNHLSVFFNLPQEQKILLQNYHTSKTYQKGQIIYREGETPEGLICLSTGKAKIYKEFYGGREQILRLAKPVGFIGYRALFAGEVYRSTAMALEESTICLISSEGIYSAIKQSSDFSLNIITNLAKELGFSNKRTISLTQKHVRGRLAESILFLKEIYGTEEDGSTLKIYLSREDIASLSNMTTSNAIRTLSAFAKEKILSIKGRRLKILDLEQLLKINELG